MGQHSIREMNDICLKDWSGCNWKKVGLDLLLRVVEELGTDDTTLFEVVEPSSFVPAGDRLLVHLNSSYASGCPGDTRTATKSSDGPVEEPESHNCRENVS